MHTRISLERWATGLILLFTFLVHGWSQATIIDDFSEGDWKQSTSTPGEFSIKPGKMHMQDAREEPSWITASRMFTVDFDKTPFFVVKVTSVSDRGLVKLIRQNPRDKKTVLQIDRPGLYAINIAATFGWIGKHNVKTCLYAIGDEGEITYAFVKYTETLTAEEESLIKKRKSTGNIKLKLPPFAIVPLFNACSVYFTSPRKEALSVLYRKKGGKWLNAFQPVYIEEDGMYRGSIVNLDENTLYELKIINEGNKKLAQKTFKTLSSEVPVAKTIVLNEENFKGHMVVKESGSQEGWIKYTSEKGFILQNERERALIELYKTEYIILEGLTLRGGDNNAIIVRRCKHIRIINCDISGWGRIGVQRFDLDGKYYTKKGRAINWDAGILISKSLGTVVERCYIHDPVSTANSWYYSHPAGPEAVGIDKPMSTVLRYNDFIGSDAHRWNDAVEGTGNFHVDGGFNRDADIYGNMMCFANDDGIEIDGGQTNVRVFLNKVEGCLCGISIQGCMSGPSYLFRNLLVNMGDENGVGGQTIKTSSYANGKSAMSFIFNNTCYGRSRDLHLPRNLRIVAKNNIFSGRRAISGRAESPQSECDYNLLSTGEKDDEKHGILGKPKFVNARAALFAPVESSLAVGRGTPIENFMPEANGKVDMGAISLDSDLTLPYRPIPVFLDKYQLNFSPKDSSSQTITATITAKGFSGKYKIRKNDAFDWFKVTPDSGVLCSGKNIIFTVSVLPAMMRERPIYKGLFLVRLENGYSRPVTVYAETGISPETKPTQEGVLTEYIEVEEPIGGKKYKPVADASASGGTCILFSGEKAKDPAQYTFSIPKAGKYFILMRVRSDKPVGTHDSVYFSIDDKQLRESHLRSSSSWVWSLAAQNRKSRLTKLQTYELTAGEHMLRIAPRESTYVDLIVVTDNPGLFD